MSLLPVGVVGLYDGRPARIVVAGGELRLLVGEWLVQSVRVGPGARETLLRYLDGAA